VIRIYPNITEAYLLFLHIE